MVALCRAPPPCDSDLLADGNAGRRRPRSVYLGDGSELW